MATSTITNPLIFQRAINNGYSRNGKCEYAKIGQLVLVRIQDMIMTADITHSSADSQQPLWTGLPAPASDTANIFEIFNHEYGIMARVIVYRDGSIRPHYTTMQSEHGQYYGSFWYIAA